MPKFGRFVDQTGWTSWTPTVTQSGNITSTKAPTSCFFKQSGKTVEMRGTITVNDGTGALANNAISVSLPVNAVFRTATSAREIVGGGRLLDNSATLQYPALAYIQSATLLRFLDAVSSTPNNPLGQAVLTAALAVDDRIDFYATYEAA